MASSMFVVGVTLKAFDQMSSVIGNAQRNLTGFQKKLEGVRESAEKVGRAGLADGLIVGAGLQKSISAFADLENASVRLKTVMMNKDGTVGAFQQVNDLAVKLGNKMPGTTSDFLNMMATLKSYNLTDASILGGVGEAAANLAVLLKMTPDAAAEFAAEMKNATGTADKDMMGLMDTIQRLNFMGVKSTDMMYSFARSAGALKVFKIQGLEATKALAPVFAMLLKGGASGETVGTGFASILNNITDKKRLGSANKMLAGQGLKLNLFDKSGQLKPIRDLVAEFDKLKNLDPMKLNAVLKELTGGGQDQQMLGQIITQGLEGYDKTVADMKKQADLQKRVNAQLGTLANLWEAASGTFANALAAFAETFAPELKMLTEWFGRLSEGIFNFTKSHPLLSKWLGLAAVGFVGAALGLGALAIAFAGVLKYIALVSAMFAAMAGPARVIWGIVSGLTWLVKLLAGALLKDLAKALLLIGRLAMAHPLIAIISLIALGALAIIENWEPIKAFFADLWAGVKQSFSDAWDWISAKANSMPEWMKTLFGMGGSPNVMAPAQTRMAPAVPGVERGNPSVDLGGRTDIYIHDERMTVKTTSNDKRMAFNVHAGPLMAGAN